MSIPQTAGDVLEAIQQRQRKSRRGRVCPWFRGRRITDPDVTASQIRPTPQGAVGESGAQDSPERRKG